MSNISTVYDRILVEMDTLFPPAEGYTRIPYAYDLIKNDDNLLRNGWGVRIGSATRNDLEFCTLAFDRSISVIFTRESFNTGNNFTAYDDIVKDLLEDINTVTKRFYGQDQIEIDASVVRIEPTDVSEVEQVEGEKVTFLSMEATFNFTIQENL